MEEYKFGLTIICCSADDVDGALTHYECALGDVIKSSSVIINLRLAVSAAKTWEQLRGKNYVHELGA